MIRPLGLHSSWLGYRTGVVRIVLLLPFVLGSCAGAAVVAPPSIADVRPVVAADNLEGRWAITAVNGRPVRGPWLELGGEGLGTVTDTGAGVFVASPQPPTRAFLGCNNWYPNGWARNGDKLRFGIEMSRRTERGCDPATLALDDAAFAILHEAMTMEFTPPDRLRLINEKGTLDLARGEATVAR